MDDRRSRWMEPTAKGLLLFLCSLSPASICPQTTLDPLVCQAQRSALCTAGRPAPSVTPTPLPPKALSPPALSRFFSCLSMDRDKQGTRGSSPATPAGPQGGEELTPRHVDCGEPAVQRLLPRVWVEATLGEVDVDVDGAVLLDTLQGGAWGQGDSDAPTPTPMS